MAKCNNCGIPLTVEMSKIGELCAQCNNAAQNLAQIFQEPESHSSTKSVEGVSLGNGLTAVGFLFIFFSFFAGDMLSAINYNGTVFQQIALTLSFGFIGIAFIMVGIAKTFLDVITANNEKDKS